MLFDIPRVTSALFEVLEFGEDVPAAREAAYKEIVDRAHKFLIFAKIKRLARRWRRPESRYVGIMILGDLAETAESARLIRKSRRELERLLRSERNERNVKLIEQMLNLSPATGLGSRLSKASLARKVAAAVR